MVSPDDWRPIFIAAFTWPILPIIVAMMPAIIRRWKRSIPKEKFMSSTSDIRITRPNSSAAVLIATATNAIAIRAGTTIEVAGQTHAFEAETLVGISDLVAGTDYAVLIDETGAPFATPVAANPMNTPFVAGFHFAPGGNAVERSGGGAIPSINPFSIWDRYFRPGCADPRGMTLVEAKDGHRFWVDIYLTDGDHKDQGTSRCGVKIADGWSLDRLDFKVASEIVASHGKRLLTYEEFRTAAFGVTERSSANGDPEKTGLDAARTSKFGLMQATGNLWVWGTDGDPDDPRPSIFGGSWISGSDAGSRYAFLACFGDSSNGNVGCRAGSDHLQPA